MAKSGEITFLVHPRAAGRATVMLCFRSTQGQDRGCLSMHYIVLLPLRRLLQAFGSFQSSVAWLPASSQDPFGRGSAVLPWNRQLSVHVLHDPRCAPPDILAGLWQACCFQGQCCPGTEGWALKYCMTPGVPRVS